MHPTKHYIFYEESVLLTQLKYYPYVQFGVIGIFLIVADSFCLNELI